MKAMLGVVMALALTTPALADGNADGNAGLDAMNQGDNQRAVALFTSAIRSGDLSKDDKEFATANRGRAYANLGQTDQAIEDLDRARRMKPDDADAQKDLVSLLQAKLPADQIPDLPKAGFWESLGRSVGQSILQGAQQGISDALSGQSGQ